MKVRGKTVSNILHKYILGYFGNQQKATDLKNNRFQKTTDFKKQQISRNNRFQKTTNFKKQQISKSNRYQKTDFKNNK